MKNKYSKILGLMWLLIAVLLTSGLIFGIKDGTMKQTKSIILGIVWILVAILLFAVLIKGIKGQLINKNGSLISINTRNTRSENAQIYKTQKISAEKIRNIKSDLLSEALIINSESDDNSNIILELRGSAWDEKNEPQILTYDESLSIQGKKDFRPFFSERYVIIRMPKSLMQKEDLVINGKSLSGSVKANGLSVNELNLTSKSGSVKVDEINCKKAELISTSGSVHINGAADELVCESISGSIHSEGAFEKIKASSTSGSIHADCTKVLTGDSSFQSTSGSVKVALPSESKFKLNFSSTSGSVHNEFSSDTIGKKGTQTIGDDSVQITASSVSGSIRIKKR